MTIHPLSSLQSPKFRDELKKAHLIFGRDKSRAHAEILFFGKERLEKVARGQLEFSQCDRIDIEYDQTDGDQLEFLVAAIEVLRGSCCYN